MMGEEYRNLKERLVDSKERNPWVAILCKKKIAQTRFVFKMMKMLKIGTNMIK